MIHIAIDNNHLTLCGQCTCTNPDLKFEYREEKLTRRSIKNNHTSNCSKCLEVLDKFGVE